MDIYDAETHKLLVKFRKKVLKKTELKIFYDATYDFTSKMVTPNRGNTTGSKKRNLKNNPKVKSAILGYFDRWGAKEKMQFRRAGEPIPLEVRETRFSAAHPDKFQKALPLIKSIDNFYQKMLNKFYKKQRQKADETHFKIPETSFTTITTNINFQTSIHKDSGDDEEGFGNLAVIENGSYTGAETCLSQYGIGIDVRQGDILFMDVHEWHGNLPMFPNSKDATRMSIVCYLRTKVWERTRNKSKAFKKNT
ncbi:MAG: hypothetical protein HOI84_05230 [Flavobacteriaceae bacterium]|nr:hypothetical protein [Flavobacteriaceae bacterium]